MAETLVPFCAPPPEPGAGLGGESRPERLSAGDVVAAKVRELFDKYADNDYVMARIHGLVCNQLPHLMDCADRGRVERQRRIDGMTDEQTAFVQLFVTNNRYFYCERTDKFFYYDLDRYVLYSEDDILHLVLSTISRSQSALVAWKRRTRTAVMQRIKRNSILEAVPESDTIQRVMDSLYPALFPSRADAKYFLTVVGDNLRRANAGRREARADARAEAGLVHFIDVRAKAFVRELSQACVALFGVGAHHSFKHRCHPEHDYAHCRIARINACASLPANWRFLAQGDRGLELFVVAAHYSARHGGSDSFLANELEGETIAGAAGFLRGHTPDSLVAAFVAEYLEIASASLRLSCEPPPLAAIRRVAPPAVPIVRLASSPSIDSGSLRRSLEFSLLEMSPRENEGPPAPRLDCAGDTEPRHSSASLSWKSMQYLWQQFLDANHAPCVMFTQPLKERLIAQTHGAYVAESDVFRGVFSRFLPDVSAFLHFWKTTMVEDEGERDMEMDEVVEMFRAHGGAHRGMSSEVVAGIIAHYLPDTELEGGKHVHGVRCALWDKRADIDAALAALRQELILRRAASSPAQWEPHYATTLYDIYVYYSARRCAPKRSAGGKARALVASKRYVDRYVAEALGALVVDFEFVKGEWLAPALA